MERSFLTCDCRCSLHHLLLVSAGDQSGRIGDKIPEVFEILTFSSLVLFPLSSLPRTATWRGEAKRESSSLSNLAASCSSFSCQMNFSLKFAALPLQALPPQLSLSKGLLLCYLLLSSPSKAALCPMDNLLT